jgi:hypothetical protein
MELEANRILAHGVGTRYLALNPETQGPVTTRKQPSVKPIKKKQGFLHNATLQRSGNFYFS